MMSAHAPDGTEYSIKEPVTVLEAWLNGASMWALHDAYGPRVSGMIAEAMDMLRFLPDISDPETAARMSPKIVAELAETAYEETRP